MQIEGRNAVLEALKNGREIDYIYIKKGENEGSINKIIGKAKDMKIMIKVVDKNKLDEMSESKNHQGIIAVANEYRYFELEEILEQTREKAGFFLILDEIEDPHNLGAIIRSAEASGVDAIIIPKRRACQVNATVEKTAAGATSHIKIVRVTNLAQTIEKLKESGIWIYSVDMDGADYTKTDLKGKIALVIGNEGKGISRLVKEKSDFTVSIPMKGAVESLNVSVASGVCLYEALRQRA